MLFNRDIPKKADIFKKSKRLTTRRANYKPLKKTKTAGIVLASIGVLLSLAIIILPGKQINSTAQAMISCPFMQNGNKDHGCGNWWRNQNANDPDNDGDNDTTQAVTVASVTPFPTTDF